MREDADIYEFRANRRERDMQKKIADLTVENMRLNALVQNGIARATITYVSGMTCPCCGGTQFNVGHSSAECASCDTPFSIARQSPLHRPAELTA
jgi:transposase-like protein